MTQLPVETSGVLVFKLDGEAVSFDPATLQYHIRTDLAPFEISVRIQSGAAPFAIETPSLAASAIVGAHVAVETGEWSGDPEPQISVAWEIDGEIVEGANDETFVPSEADAGKTLRAIVTATNDHGSATARTAPAVITDAAPARVADFPDVTLLQGKTRTIDAAAAFTGRDLAYSVTGPGATIDTGTGTLTLAAEVAADGATITITATNSGGSAAGSFLLTVQSDDVTLTPIAPSAVSGPALSGAGLVGTTLEVDPGQWSGLPVPRLSPQWLRDGAAVSGATGTRYVLTDADDNAEIACRVTALNTAGAEIATTAARRAVYRAPTLLAELGEDIFDLGTGPQKISTASHFKGEKLVYSATGGKVTIDAATGVLTIPTGSAVSGLRVIVTASNSGGSAQSLYLVTIEDEAGSEPGSGTGASEGTEDRVAFAGPRLVQVVLHENEITTPDYIEVRPGKDRVWSPDANNRLGGQGEYTGRAGNFSGDSHAAAPQLFFPWPEARATEYTSAFAVIDDGEANLSAADRPENWTVRVAGRAMPIASVFRKTVPVETGQTGPWTYESRRRHLVTLSLASDLPDGADVEVSPPGGAPVFAQYDGSVISEAIHTCQAGYAAAGPKKAYVGLWLGCDRTGKAGTTNEALSSATGWKLVRITDNREVAEGKLTLAVPQSQTHQSGLNYNGCDIYEADFSHWTEDGAYRLEVEGVGSSFSFPIGEEVYAEAFRLAARWYFHQRSGCGIDAVHGEGRVRPRNDHPDDGAIIYQTDVLLGRHSEGFVGSSHVFEVLKKVDTSAAAITSGTTGGAIASSNATETAPLGELVPEGIFDKAELWSILEPSFQLSGDALEIRAAAGYRNASLELSGKTSGTSTYRLRIRVSQLAGTVRTKLIRGTYQDMITLSEGLNEIEITAAECAGLYLDAGSGTSARIEEISLAPASSASTGTPGNTGGAVKPSVGNADAWGGWHDAGDWDRRIQHMGVVFTMAEMIETLPVLRDFDLNIPESGRTFADPAIAARKNAADTGDGKTVLPDLIHEALWGISLWRRTQHADGGIIGGVEYSLDGIAGSVSWNHLQTMYAYAPEEWSAYQFVTGAAKLGHVIRTVCGDEVLGAALISEATAAWRWAEKTLGSGIDIHNDYDETRMARVRIPAAAALYRATGDADARSVFEAYNAFLPLGEVPLPSAGNPLGTSRGDYMFEAWDYVRAGREGRPVDRALSNAITDWSARRIDGDSRIGADYGLHSTSLYPWGAGWMRFGPGSNWRCGRLALDLLAKGAISREAGDAALEGMWFGLGCNPSNVSLVQGIGARTFGDPLLLDGIDGPVPGNPCFGPAAGVLRFFELNSMGDSIYPKKQAVWPRYAAIFESRRAVVSSEHGMKSNALEWLFACGFVAQVLSER